MKQHDEITLSGSAVGLAQTLNVHVLSERIKPGHALWEEMEKLGCSVEEFDERNFSCTGSDKNLLLIDDPSEMISAQWVNILVQNRQKLESVKKILVASPEDQYVSFKQELFHCDALLELASYEYPSVEQFARTITEIADVENKADIKGLDWRKFTNKLLQNVGQSGIHRKLIQDLVLLGSVIVEYDYLLKSLLKLLSDAFKSQMASIYVCEDNTIYTLIIKNVDESKVTSHIESMRTAASGDEDKRNPAEIIWGRRLINDEKAQGESPTRSTKSIDLNLRMNNELIGYCSLPVDENAVYDNNFLNLLSVQVTFLLNSALLYRTQHRLIQNNFLRLGAISEVCKLFSGLDRKDFGLQFLLILLEYLSADKGILSLMSETGERGEVFSVGFDDLTKVWLIGDSEVLPWMTTLAGNEQTAGVLNLPGEVEKGRTSSFFYTGFPLFDVQGKIGVIFILFRNQPNDQDDFAPFFQTMATLASTHFANIGLYHQFLEKRIMEEQINIARDIQRELLPKSTPVLEDFYLAGASRPATQVGGDFYDFIEMSDDKYAIVIGDVSGKGIPASQLMSMTKSLLKFRIQQGSDLIWAMSDVNHYLTCETPAEKYVTSLAILIDQKKKNIDVVNAGHGPLLIYRIHKHEFEEIESDGLALGILPKIKYDLAQTSYTPGDVMLMFTDGLSEAMSPTHEQFGMERIKKIIIRMADATVEDILKEFYDAISEHAQGMPQHDDTTIVVMKAK